MAMQANAEGQSLPQTKIDFPFGALRPSDLELTAPRLEYQDLNPRQRGSIDDRMAESLGSFVVYLDRSSQAMSL